MNVMGYWMRSLASSCKALVGKMTRKKETDRSAVNYLRSHGFERAYEIIASACGSHELTFVSPIEFGLADKGRTVDAVAAEEHVGWVGVASADIAGDGLIAATVMAFILVTATSEKAIPLFYIQVKFWLTHE